MSDKINPTTNDADADANSASARGSAGVATAQDQDYAYQNRAGRVTGTDTARVSDFDKDTGTDERMEITGADRSDSWFANGKRTYDLHQTLDADGLHQSRLDGRVERERGRRNEDAETAMRLRQAETEFNRRLKAEEEDRQEARRRREAEAEQTRRHYEDMHTLRVLGVGGVTDSVVESISDRTAEKVCTRLTEMTIKPDAG